MKTKEEKNSKNEKNEGKINSNLAEAETLGALHTHTEPFRE